MEQSQTRTVSDSPIVIKTRKELIFLLSEAATLEHMIMCQYLFASFALKRETGEGITSEQLRSISDWDRTILTVAQQEMLHLCLVNNLLSSVGAGPFFGRPNFPVRSRYFPSRVRLALMPLDEVSLSYFLYLERPESISIENVPGFVREGLAINTEAVVPVGQEMATVGQLYRGIDSGFEYLADKYGENRLFIGSPIAQATREHFGWEELVTVKDQASARKAIETIVIEGEGARGDWKDSHFGHFVRILNEYKDLKQKDPQFEPSRPVVAAFSRPLGDPEAQVELIEDEFTAEVSDLFNASYQVLLQILSRFFLPVETTNDDLRTLSRSSIMLMLAVIKPLGNLLTALPVGHHRPGLTTGPVFEMYPMSYLLPRNTAAWTILNERLDELSFHSKELSARPKAAEALSEVAETLARLAELYHTPA